MKKKLNPEIQVFKTAVNFDMLTNSQNEGELRGLIADEDDEKALDLFAKGGKTKKQVELPEGFIIED
jgi:hypothetical protein